MSVFVHIYQVNDCIRPVGKATALVSCFNSTFPSLPWGWAANKQITQLIQEWVGIICTYGFLHNLGDWLMTRRLSLVHDSYKLMLIKNNWICHQYHNINKGEPDIEEHTCSCRWKRHKMSNLKFKWVRERLEKYALSNMIITNHPAELPHFQCETAMI